MSGSGPATPAGPEEPRTSGIQDPAAAAPGRRRRRRGGLVALVVVAIVLIGAAFVRLPYFVLEPGSATDVIPLIHIRGHPVYPPEGKLLLTDVELFQPNAYQLVGAWFSSTEAIYPQSDFLAPGETIQQQTVQAFSEMDTSKINAAIVALSRFAGYPKKHGPGALIQFVQPGTPAGPALAAGDVVVSVNGAPVRDVADLGKAIRATSYGNPVHLVVRQGSKTRHVTVRTAHIRGLDYPAIGVAVVANFPFPIAIDSQDIGGPSAGLMWSLGLSDLLTPGSLSHGEVIAGTGEIDPDGQVLPIGGVQQKVVAAERAGAKIFFTPVANANDAASVAHGIKIVPVRTYSQALTYLRSLK